MTNTAHRLRIIRLIIAALPLLMLRAQGASSQAVPPWMDTELSPEARAELVLKQMTLNEKIGLLHGNGMSIAAQWQMPLTYLANGGAGYVKGVERLGIPSLYVSDAANGVRGSGANGRYSTSLPSNLGATSTWDPALACDYGALIGRELRAQGFNMSLGGGMNLTREPRNGRTFEYAGEDPLLAGVMVGNLMKCEQAEHVIGDIKHYVLNAQETGRNIVNAEISKRALQETDLLAFHIALDIGKPAAVMCSFNKINGDYGCENSYMLKEVLKKDWGFKGFVVSDWGGTHSTRKASAAGLDQEEPMADFFGPALEDDVKAGNVPMAEIDDHVRRVLYGEFLAGVVDHPAAKTVVDAIADGEMAQHMEERSIVLLKNKNAVLPLQADKIHSVAVIGGHADVAMLSGGGSAQVDPPEGDALLSPGEGSTYWRDRLWFRTSPLKALREQLPTARIDYNQGKDLEAAAALARSANVAIVFAYQWQSEGIDLPTLNLPDNQDALIERVAASNPHTIVVLESGSAVTMPWIDQVSGIVEAWYPGTQGHIALANVLTGKVNPSGKLAMTFPRSDADLPHPVIAPLSAEDAGAGSGAVDDRNHFGSKYAVHYSEGVKVGYKWYETEHKVPLFPFGFGLSYTSYAYSHLQVDSGASSITFTVKNTGTRAGREIAQVYVQPTAATDESFTRLSGWQVLALEPGEAKTVTVRVDPRILAVFDEATDRWVSGSGRFHIFVGPSSTSLPLRGELQLP